MGIHEERQAMLDEQNSRARYEENGSFTLEENGGRLSYI